MKKAYKHVIWDWNGTIINDSWLGLEVINAMLKQRKMNLTTLDDYREQFDFPVIHYYEQLGFDWKKESFEDLSVEFITNYEKQRHKCGLQEEALEVIRLLDAKGISQSILSAYEQEYLEQAVRDYDLSNYFSLLTGSDNVNTEGKVHLVDRHKSAVHCPSEQALFIGDTTHDALVAQKMGVDCVLVAQGHHSLSRLKACGATGLDTLTDLKKIELDRS